MGRGPGAKRVKIENSIGQILNEAHPMTVRQVYYQLVSRQVIPNTKYEYQNVCKILVYMRKVGRISWDWVEDRIRRPRMVSMWGGLSDFAETAVRAYRRDVWETQPELIEVWVEKDALSGIFEEELEPYGVTLNVGRGYDGWSSIYRASARYYESGKRITVLYFGDFDPSGMDISRSLDERLDYFTAGGELVPPDLVRCALNKEDVTRYRLPHDFTKSSDTRQQGFVERYGDMAVELDALPVGILRERVRREVETRLDLNALRAVRKKEEGDREKLRELFG